MVINLFDNIDFSHPDIHNKELFALVKKRCLQLKDELGVTEITGKEKAGSLLFSMITNSVAFPTKTKKDEDNMRNIDTHSPYCSKDNVKIKILDKCFFASDYSEHKAVCLHGLSDNNITAMVSMSFMKLINDTHCMGTMIRRNYGRNYGIRFVSELRNEGYVCHKCNDPVTVTCLRHYPDCDECAGNFIVADCTHIRFCSSCTSKLSLLKDKYKAYGGCLNCAENRVLQTFLNLSIYISILDINVIFADDFYVASFLEYLLKCNSILLYQIGAIEDVFKDH